MALGEENNTAGPPSVDKYHLLVIGVEYYTNYARLPNTVTDAARVAAVLTDKYRFDRPENFGDLRNTDARYNKPEYTDPICVYEGPQTTCLFNEHATKTAIQNKLNELAGRRGNNALGENDALVIYFAGHGIFQDPFYSLLLTDSDITDPATMLSTDEIAMAFKSYTTQKKGRHVLLILDSCFAGGAGFGITTTQTGQDRFSRQILTSCSAEQPADDGLLYVGSAFANAFCNALKDNQVPTIQIEDLKLLQESKFAADVTKSSDVQRIELGAMPGALGGGGSFPFERRELQKPDIDHLRKSIIEHLDFEYQRANLSDSYVKKRDQLNIIKSQGSNIRTQQMLAKVVFDWFRIIQKIDFDPGDCIVPAAINLDMHGDEEIFSIINKNIKTPGTDYDPPMILQWFTDQMKTTDVASYNNRHLILRIAFTGSPAKRVEQVEKFCLEFIRLFTAWSGTLSEKERAQYGKVFLLIADASATGLELNSLTVQSPHQQPLYNFIPFQKISKIKYNHIKYWITRFSAINKSELVQKLTDDDVLVKWIADDEFEHDTFIERFCSYCGFTQQETDNLNAQLYDYNKTFLIQHGKNNP